VGSGNDIESISQKRGTVGFGNDIIWCMNEAIKRGKTITDNFEVSRKTLQESLKWEGGIGCKRRCVAGGKIGAGGSVWNRVEATAKNLVDNLSDMAQCISSYTGSVHARIQCIQKGDVIKGSCFRTDIQGGFLERSLDFFEFNRIFPGSLIEKMKTSPLRARGRVGGGWKVRWGGWFVQIDDTIQDRKEMIWVKGMISKNPRSERSEDRTMKRKDEVKSVTQVEQMGAIVSSSGDGR
jgi:hypothetical protein